jgi:hypothetical protein
MIKVASTPENCKSESQWKCGLWDQHTWAWSSNPYWVLEASHFIFLKSLYMLSCRMRLVILISFKVARFRTNVMCGKNRADRK